MSGYLVPRAAGRLHGVTRIVRREQLRAIDFVEFVMLSTEVTIDRQLAQVGKRSIDFLLAQHDEHVPNLLPIAAAVEAWMAWFEDANGFFPKEPAQ